MFVVLEKSIYFFIINEILSIFFLFFGLVYNEYAILLFCGLDQETKYGMHKRMIYLSRDYTTSIVMNEDYIFDFDVYEKDEIRNQSFSEIIKY